jgi:hypothetical protein
MERKELIKRLEDLENEYQWFGVSSGYGVDCTIYYFNGEGYYYAGVLGSAEYLMIPKDNYQRLTNWIMENGISEDTANEMFFEELEEDVSFLAVFEFDDIKYLKMILEDCKPDTQYYKFYDEEGYYEAYELGEREEVVPWQDLDDEELKEWNTRLDFVSRGINSWYDLPYHMTDKLEF